MRNCKRLDVANCSDEQLKLILDHAADVRKFEIERFWHRSLFFWGFISAAFIAFASLSEKKEELFPLLIACFGLVCSFAWTLQNRGSKYWQEAWEQKIEAVEKRVLGTELFSHREPLKTNGHWRAGAFSVSRLAVALSDFTAFIWACLLIKAFPISALPTFLSQGQAIFVSASLNAVTTWGICLITAVYILLLFTWGRSND